VSRCGQVVFFADVSAHNFRCSDVKSSVMGDFNCVQEDAFLTVCGRVVFFSLCVFGRVTSCFVLSSASSVWLAKCEKRLEELDSCSVWSVRLILYWIGSGTGF